MRILFALFALTLVACTRTPVSQKTPAATASDSIAAPGAPDNRSYIRRQIDLLDSARYTDYFDDQPDMLDSINRNIYKALERLTSNDAYQTAPLGEQDGISYLLSDNKKFYLISWDTRMGGTMIDFVAVAIYKSDTGTKIKFLGGADLNTGTQGDLTYFTDLYTLADADGTATYLAYGMGQASTLFPWRKLQAFRIGSDTLDQTLPTFSDRGNSFSYDLSAFRNQEDIPEITFSADHREIQAPEVEGGAPTRRYIKYHFSEGVYHHVE
jgi:hypothetical protein